MGKTHTHLRKRFCSKDIKLKAKTDVKMDPPSFTQCWASQHKTFTNTPSATVKVDNARNPESTLGASGILGMILTWARTSTRGRQRDTRRFTPSQPSRVASGQSRNVLLPQGNFRFTVYDPFHWLRSKKLEDKHEVQWIGEAESRSLAESSQHVRHARLLQAQKEGTFDSPGLGCTTTSLTRPSAKVAPVGWQLATIALKIKTYPATMAFKIKTVTVPKRAEVFTKSGMSAHLGRVERDWQTFCHPGSKSTGTSSCNPALGSHKGWTLLSASATSHHGIVGKKIQKLVTFPWLVYSHFMKILLRKIYWDAKHNDTQMTLESDAMWRIWPWDVTKQNKPKTGISSLY